jgi:acetylornithine deacetylase/succinyl-diaminopimelate desuccinylase-like protein
MLASVALAAMGVHRYYRSWLSTVRRRAHEGILVAPTSRGPVEYDCEESLSATVHFDAALRDELAAALPDAPILDTGAGHDAGVLGNHVPTAMLFVRKPTGVSHSPAEHIEAGDAETVAAA